MFSNLRIGQQFYILRKGDNPSCEIGNVVSVSTPAPKFPNNFQFPQNQEMVVDVKVKVGENNLDFKQLPASMQIADFQGMVISENKEAINSEIEALRNQSIEALNKVDIHKQIVEACDGILKTINPQYAKEKEQEEKITSLESRLGGMEGNLDKMMSMLSEALKTNNKQTKN